MPAPSTTDQPRGWNRLSPIQRRIVVVAVALLMIIGIISIAASLGAFSSEEPDIESSDELYSLTEETSSQESYSEERCTLPMELRLHPEDLSTYCATAETAARIEADYEEAREQEEDRLYQEGVAAAQIEFDAHMAQIDPQTIDEKLGAAVWFACTSKGPYGREVAEVYYDQTWPAERHSHMWPEWFEAARKFKCATEPEPTPTPTVESNVYEEDLIPNT